MHIIFYDYFYFYTLNGLTPNSLQTLVPLLGGFIVRVFLVSATLICMSAKILKKKQENSRFVIGVTIIFFWIIFSSNIFWISSCINPHRHLGYYNKIINDLAYTPDSSLAVLGCSRQPGLDNKNVLLFITTVDSEKLRIKPLSNEFPSLFLSLADLVIGQNRGLPMDLASDIYH